MKNIIEHYKKFFGLEGKALPEEDHLMIDWAEALLKDFEVGSLYSLIKKFEPLKYKAFGFQALQISYSPIMGIWSCGLRNEYYKKPSEHLDNDKSSFENKDLKVCLTELYKYCQEKGYLEAT